MLKTSIIVVLLMLSFIVISCDNLFAPYTPNAPSNLDVDAISSASTKLTWQDNSSNEDGFYLHRSLNSDFSSYTEIDLNANSISYVDKNLASDNTYYYRIMAFDGSIHSEWSNTVDATPVSNATIPIAPSGLSGSAINSFSVSLNWTDNSDNESSFILQYDDENSFTNPSERTITANQQTLTLSSLTSETTWYFRIAAQNITGTSSWSNIAPIETPQENTETVIQVSFEDGTEWGGQKVYAIWLANETENYYQNIYICNRINLQNLTGTGLPYWENNVRSFFTSSDIDDISSATVATGDFIESVILTDNSITEFTVYFEIDHSWDGNDWFSDQPAILYSAEVNLLDSVSTYTMDFIGWTPNENTDGGIPGGVDGVLNQILGFITNMNDGANGFGELEPEPATALVGGLTVDINP